MMVLVKGAGDLATGIAHRLFVSGYQVIMTEKDIPTTVRRKVAFSAAVYQGSSLVEGVTARLAENVEQVQQILLEKAIPVIIDEEADIRAMLCPEVVVDAILAKRNLGTALSDAPLVIGVGPGFRAGQDCHGVIETKRGHDLGRVIRQGCAAPDTGIPGNIGGYTVERLIRATAEGRFQPLAAIGEKVEKGQEVARIYPVETDQSGVPVYAGMSGVVRGMLQEGVRVTLGMKAGDIDSSCEVEHCFTISDKARAVAGGVLEEIVRYEHCR